MLENGLFWSWNDFFGGKKGNLRNRLPDMGGVAFQLLLPGVVGSGVDPIEDLHRMYEEDVSQAIYENFYSGLPEGKIGD